MKGQGSGRIVNIASSAGKAGGTLAGAHYSVSKAGLICLAKQLARELGAHGITVNAVAPGRIDTPMIQIASAQENEAFVHRTPLGRLGTAEDVANAVLFLASDEASFITGEIVDVNGGLLID
jgi:3-oxoacyl-[acyl-carrier protein] reductase